MRTTTDNDQLPGFQDFSDSLDQSFSAQDIDLPVRDSGYGNGFVYACGDRE